jgi:seryl-tRNA synthetase
MIDIAFIRDNAELVKTAALNKNVNVDIDRLLVLDEQRRTQIAAIEELRAQRNELTAAAKGQRPSDEQIATGAKLKEELAKLEVDFDVVDKEYQELLLAVPNIPTSDTPVGKTEDENVVVKTVGKKPEFDFVPKTHAEIAELHDWIDKPRAAKVAGSRFLYLKGSLVRLQFALVNWVMDQLGDEAVIAQIIKDNDLDLPAKAFTPVIPPMLVNTKAYQATARLDAEEVTYKLSEDELWLNASAEHSLANMYMNETLPAEQLPIRYIGYATSFRREAGTYGKDMEGMFRNHQFDKLEMETFSTPETGLAEHHLMAGIQEYLLQQLGLHYQVLLKCTADIGTPNARGVDIESWLPGQDAYRETHSADFMADYQARRAGTKFKNNDGTSGFVHNNDATAVVLSRVPIAILEQYQQADGSVLIPEVLRSYMGKNMENKEVL